MAKKMLLGGRQIKLLFPHPHRKKLVVGATKDLTMSLHLANTGDGSYLTSVVLEYPENLRFKKVQEVSGYLAADLSPSALL